MTNFKRQSSTGCMLLVASIVSFVLSATEAPAQGVRYNWGGYGSPATAASLEINAEANFVRAVGEYQVNEAQARQIRAQAVRQEIANSTEYVKGVWERRSIAEAERLKRYVSFYDRKQLQDSKTWERLKEYPELSETAIIQGEALNFLLNRLAATTLAYKFSMAGGGDLSDLKQLDLPPEILHSLQLRQERSNGKSIRFRADEGVALAVDWWPYLLRGEEFAAGRKNFETARTKIVYEAQHGEASNAAFKELLKAHDGLTNEFHDRFNKRTAAKSTTTHEQYYTAERFLKAMAGEIARLQNTGGKGAFDGSLKFEGENLVELLTHMSRTGLDFAEAKSGEEAAYRTVFRMMRDLYLTVADTKN